MNEYKAYCWISIILIQFFCTPIAAQDTSANDFEVVYTNKNFQFNNSFIVKLVAGYKDESILVASLDFSKANPINIHQSIDQGNNWQLLMEQPDSFNEIVSIQHPSANHICAVVKGFAKDTAGNWIKNYWIKYSADLGKSWIEHNAGGLPLGFQFKGKKGVFASTTNDTAMLWTTENYGLSWQQHQLPSNMTHTLPKRLSDDEFIFFDNTNDGISGDSIYYTADINLGQWDVKKLHEDFGQYNCIAFNRNKILSAKQVWANIGSTALSHILETSNGGDTWSTPVNVWEDSAWSRRGLVHNSFLDSNKIVFLGPNIIYSTQNGVNSWEKAIWNDSIRGGTRGVYLFYNSKLQKEQLIFPVDSFILRYTLPGPVGIEELFVSDNKELGLHPNPAKNSLTIQLDESVRVGGDIRIWSIDGKEVIRRIVLTSGVNHTITLDISALNSGAYIVKYESSDRLYSNQFIKQ